MKIAVAARASKLSQVQVWEVHNELVQHYPEVEFVPVWVTTTGDKDHITSLRALEKTDFFTKEIDALVLEGTVRLRIHSAKDLPEPLPHGLTCMAITDGVASHDSLVYQTLPQNPKIATSSLRREKIIKELFPGAEIVDIRGTIEVRLEKMFSGIVDGVVIAEAALIRLGLTHLQRMTLPGEVALLQGKLAVVGRAGDEEMTRLFSCIDALINPRTK